LEQVRDSGAVEYLNVDEYSSTTTYASEPASTPLGSMVPFIYLQVQRTASNLVYSYSTDGVTFTTILSHSITAYLTHTPNYIGIIGLQPNGATETQFEVYWWRRTS
jgi:hypothetical protein